MNQLLPGTVSPPNWSSRFKTVSGWRLFHGDADRRRMAAESRSVEFPSDFVRGLLGDILVGSASSVLQKSMRTSLFKDKKKHCAFSCVSPRFVDCL